MFRPFISIESCTPLVANSRVRCATTETAAGSSSRVAGNDDVREVLQARELPLSSAYHTDDDTTPTKTRLVVGRRFCFIHDSRVGGFACFFLFCLVCFCLFHFDSRVGWVLLCFILIAMAVLAVLFCTFYFDRFVGCFVLFCFYISIAVLTVLFCFVFLFRYPCWLLRFVLVLVFGCFILFWCWFLLAVLLCFAFALFASVLTLEAQLLQSFCD